MVWAPIEEKTLSKPAVNFGVAVADEESYPTACVLEFATEVAGCLGNAGGWG